jgi:hypothetical protein
MLMHVSVKMNPQMKAALEKQAEKEFTTVSGLLKKAAEKYLQEQGIDWRQEKPEKKAKK